MVGDPLASVFRSGRELFNAKFQQARRRYPNLDAEAFSAFLTSTLDPLIQKLALSPEEQSLFVQSAYDVALELAGEYLLAVNSRSASLFSRMWLEILPALPKQILGSGEHVLGPMSNAVHNLVCAEGARPEEWIRALATLAPQVQTLTEFLQLGQVLGWRAGLAHYRRGALDIAAQLREPLVRGAFKIPSEIFTAVALQRLQSDVWHDPAADWPSLPKVRAIRRIGAFRGFSGKFVTPPIVASSEDQIFVSSGEDVWLLTADVFGQTLHRATQQEFASARRRSAVSTTEKVQVTAEKVVTERGAFPIGMPGTLTSFALLPDTIAVTSSATHAIQLVAR